MRKLPQKLRICVNLSENESRGAIKDVIEVVGENRKARYRLKPDHATAARKHLLKERKVPITALTAFIYRDYGFYLDTPSVTSVVALFRKEFSLADDVSDQRDTFNTLFADDTGTFKSSSLELLNTEISKNG